MKEGQRNLVNVTCALIIDDKKRLFAAQRSEIMSFPLKWELPGGKIEPGETAEHCLVREIREELNIDVEITASLPPNLHDYSTIKVKLMPFICKSVKGKIQLKEHCNFRWLNPDELLHLDWSEGDVPILDHYLNYLNAI